MTVPAPRNSIPLRSLQERDGLGEHDPPVWQPPRPSCLSLRRVWPRGEPTPRTDLLGMTVKAAPNCPKCVKPMQLNHIVPKGGGLPELSAFRCFFCNEVTTTATEDTV